MLILSKATARDPNRRYRSAKGFLRDLQRLRFLTFPKRRIVRRILVALGVAVFLGVILPALWHHPVFYSWLTMPNNWVKESMSLPYPYSLVKPLFLHHTDGEQPLEP